MTDMSEWWRNSRGHRRMRETLFGATTASGSAIGLMDLGTLFGGTAYVSDDFEFMSGELNTSSLTTYISEGFE